MTRQFLTLAVAAGLIAGAGGGALAQSSMSPGHAFKEKGSLNGSAGASGYAPGHQMQQKGSISGTTGASGYAPGRATTGASDDEKADVDAGGVKAHTDIDVDAKGRLK